ncbi:MAG: DUF2214 domain-containing protein [Tepidamorphaceae bacterium]
MDAILATLEASGAASFFRVSRWGYAALNATHVFAVALLVGSILPLDARLLGMFRSVPRDGTLRMLVPFAATGAFLTATTGVLLFSVRASEYADLDVFRIKLLLIAAGLAGAVLLHSRDGWLLQNASAARLRIHAVLSIICWTGALACGRLIAFAGN